MAFDACVENGFGAVLKALAASTPKRRPRDESQPPIPADIQDETRQKPTAEAVEDHQELLSESRVHPPAQIGDMPA